MKYTSGYKHQLFETDSTNIAIFPLLDIETPFISLTKTGKLTIEKGYASDGASGGAFDTKTIMRGAFFHDALYQLLRLGLLPPIYRVEADEELRRICLEDGMWSVRAWWVYHAVRLGGGPSADPANKRKVFTAP